ncbi:MAG: nucleotidyltransferase domain-containing protein [Nocardioides sp.]
MGDLRDEPPIAALLARVADDDNVRGLVLSGSGARGMRTEHSDLDVYVVLEDTAGQQTTKTPEIDTIVVSLAELRGLAPPPVDPEGWWTRYSFADARVLLDRTGGELTALLQAQATLTDDEVAATLDGYLDGYLNFYYRSLKSDREGRALERRLDAVESVSWLLWTVFALHGRVRPYNKYLRHDLAVRPLPEAWVGLLDDLALLMDDGDVEAQRRLFHLVDAAARVRGKGPVVDGWGAELTLMRGRMET